MLGGLLASARASMPGSAALLGFDHSYQGFWLQPGSVTPTPTGTSCCLLLRFSWSLICAALGMVSLILHPLLPIPTDSQSSALLVWGGSKNSQEQEFFLCCPRTTWKLALARSLCVCSLGSAYCTSLWQAMCSVN